MARRGRAGRSSPLEILAIFLKLGLTSFGGPVAHLGYYRAEFVERRKWLDAAGYADLVALCQFLPGPGSTEFCIAVGLLRAGVIGALAAWVGFTLPSALLMAGFGYGMASLGDLAHAPWLHGLKLVAFAVVAQAVWAMARALAPDAQRALAPDAQRALLALAAAILVLAVPSIGGQLGAIGLGALIGWRFLPGEARHAAQHLKPPVSHAVSVGALILFFALLAFLPLAASQDGNAWKLLDGFYRSGALVFGGGHVLLPLLDAVVVPNGWVSQDTFLAGYGAAQALPGPIFSFSAYLGMVMGPSPGGWRAACLALVAIFLPGFLLVVGALPFWSKLRVNQAAQSSLKGVNAAVVGLLLAALYNPIFVNAVFGARDFAFALAAFALLQFARVPPWAVVLIGAGAAQALALL
jgi:chromate transporter